MLDTSRRFVETIQSFFRFPYYSHFLQGTSQSKWPEYAIKIIDAVKVAEQNYAVSVVREVLILQLASHPNIARLISAFQFKQSAYLVLEYAAKGDLHTFLLANGRIANQTLIR
jgi:serine/threonine protein kinase